MKTLDAALERSSASAPAITWQSTACLVHCACRFPARLNGSKAAYIIKCCEFLRGSPSTWNHPWSMYPQSTLLCIFTPLQFLRAFLDPVFGCCG